ELPAGGGAAHRRELALCLVELGADGILVCLCLSNPARAALRLAFYVAIPGVFAVGLGVRDVRALRPFVGHVLRMELCALLAPFLVDANHHAGRDNLPCGVG